MPIRTITCFLILITCAADAAHFQYNFASVTQGVQVVGLTVPTNDYTVSNTKVERSIDGGQTYSEVAWQQGSSNRIWVSTGIGTGNASTNIFRLDVGAPATFSGLGYLTWITNGGTADSLFTITNGYAGAKIVNTNLAVTSNYFALVDFRFGNGVWGLTTNRQFQTSGGSLPYNTNLLHATNITVEVIESGPLLAYLRITQLFKRLAWSDGLTTIPEGTGSNVVEIKMEAFRPVIEIRESTDSYLSHQYDVSAIVTNANQLRFRNGNTMNLATWGGRLGYLWGQATNNAVTYGYDVLKDFETGIDIGWLYSGEFTNSTSIYYGETRPSGQQGGTGHYTRGSWYVIDNTNGSVASAPIFGIGNAHMSSARGAGTQALGYYPWRLSASGRYGFDVHLLPNDASGNVRTNKAIHYFLYSGTRTNLTNSASAYYWDMTREFAKMNGVGSLAKQIPTELDPTLLAGKSDWGTFTQTRVQVTNLLNRLRTGEANLSNYLVTADSLNADMVRAMADSSGYSTLVLVTNIFANASNMLGAHWERDANFETPYNFLQGGQLMGREAVRIDLVNMLSTFDTVSAGNLFALRWLALLYSRALFDQDIYPFDNILAGSYLGSLGTASMPTEYINFRSEYSTWLEPLATNGLYTVPEVISTVHGGIDGSLNAAGAPKTSTHYTIARMVPYLENVMMLAAKGTTNLMLDSALHSKVTNFVDHSLSGLTPVEVRFGTSNRYRINLGDGAVERPAIYGQLDRVIRETDPHLAARSKQAWVQLGKPLAAFFQPGFLTVYIDETVTNNLPTSLHTSGYWSALHTRQSTSYGSALWMKNGTWPDDHMGRYNSGTPNFYLLGAPVGVLRDTYDDDIFAVTGTMLYTGATPTNAVTVSGTNTFSVTTGESWAWDNDSTNTVFAGFAHSGIADCKQTRSNDIYYLTTALISPSPTFDVALIDHRFTNRLDVRYITQSLNVTGALTGTLTTVPFDEVYPTLPSIGTTNFIGPGVATFGLTNATWLNHPTTGITVQVAYHLKDGSNAVHAVYFRTGSAPTERNLQLRVVCSNDVNYVVVGRLRDASACTITTNAATGAFYVVHGREALRASTNTWEYALGTQTNAAAVFQGTAQLTATNGIGISGGPAEAFILRGANTNFTVSISGPVGTRTITNASLPYPLVIAASGGNVTRHASR